MMTRDNDNDNLALAVGDARDTERVAASLVMRGDISALTPEERARYYLATCNALGLNPQAQPFAFLRLNGKEVMYATRGATDQLAAIHRLTREIIDGPKVVDIAGAKLLYAVCRATHPSGRSETATAAVPIPQGAEAIANAVMKTETKARRRATMALLGLALLDESETDTIPEARGQVPAPHRIVPSDASDAMPDEDPERDAEPPPPPPLSGPEHRAALELLATATDLGTLRSHWDDLAPETRRATEAQRAELVAAKDARKAQLTPQPPPEDPPPDATPPRGRQRRTAGPQTVDAPGAQTTRGEPLETRAQRVAHLAQLGHALAVRASWLRHREAPGYTDACIARVQALTGCVDPAVVRRYLQQGQPVTEGQRAA